MAFRTNKVPAIEERTVSGSSVSFNSAFALPLKACKVSFSATQAGSGDPSPSNPRAISGVSAIGLTANSTPVSVSLGEERFGGELDVVSGKLVLTYGVAVYEGSADESWFYQSGAFRISIPSGGIGNTIPLMCNELNPSSTSTVDSIRFGSANIIVYYSATTSTQGFKAYLQNNSLVIVYELATPIEVALTPTQLSSIIGNNTFTTDTGTLDITFADLQEKSASGSVATFNTALAMPLVSCNIGVNAWQEGSGDPSPDNVRPIHGFSEQNITRCGKNLLNPNAEVYYNYTINADGSINTTQSNYRICTDYLPCKPSTKYAVNGGINGTPNYLFQFIEIVFYDRNKNYISRVGRSYYNFSLVVTSPVDAAYIRIGEFNPETGSVLTPAYFSEYQRQLEIGETATDYTPFVAFDTYTIQLGQEIYGAEVDADNGVAHVTHDIIDLGGLGYNKGSSGANFDRYYSSGMDRLAKNNSNLLCSILTQYNTTPIPWGMKMSSGNGKFYITTPLNEFTSITDLKSYLSGIYMVFELAEPFTIQLTPQQIETLIGNNTIFADTGDIDLTYKDLDIAKRGNFREVFKLPS